MALIEEDGRSPGRAPVAFSAPRDLSRMVIVGPPASGKSTLARELGAMLGLRVFELDILVWSPGLVRAPIAEQVQKLDEILSTGRWIVDGDHPDTQPMRYRAADTIVFLDIPWPVCLWRLMGRAARGWRARTETSGRSTSRLGVRVKAHVMMLARILAYPWAYRPRVLANLRESGTGHRVVILRHPADVRRFVKAITRLPAP